MNVTLRDVAQRAGVGYGTASRALSGNGSVSASTRAKVQQAAAALNFKPNAAAALLRSQGRRLSGDKQALRVALLSQYSGSLPLFHARCRLLGLEGAHFNPHEFASPAHMLRTLWNRGFQGLLLDSQGLPWPEPQLAAADWSPFSVVKWKRIHSSLKFHLIRHSAFDYIRNAIHQTLRCCPGKTAALLWHSGSRQDDEARLGALMVAKDRLLKAGQQLTWREWQAPSSAELDPDAVAWLRAEKPQAILAFTAALFLPLQNAGWRFPQDARFFAVLAPETDWAINLPAISGNDMRMDEVFKLALVQLRLMLGRGERGFTQYPTEQVVTPTWRFGQTG